MGWHESHTHIAWAEPSAAIVTDRALQIRRLDVMYVTIDSLKQWDNLECLGDAVQYIVGGIEVIRVQDANDISRRTVYAFVHRIIDPLIWFTHNAESLSEPLLITADDL